MNEANADYDNPWKEALGSDFEPFLAFFFPEIRDLIDWSKPPEALDKELQQIVALSEGGMRLNNSKFKIQNSKLRNPFRAKLSVGERSRTVLFVQFKCTTA